MNKILLKSFQVLFLLLVMVFIYGEGQILPLIFNIETNTIINPKKLQNPDQFKPSAAACPMKSESTSGILFNDLHSICNKSLLVKKVFQEPKSTLDISLTTCESSFETSVIFSEITNEIEFGYELYFDKNDSQFKKLKKSPYKKYKPITSMLATKPTETLLQKSSSLLKRSLSTASDTPELPFDDKNMLFIWAPIFQLNYNAELLSPIQITYEIDVGVDMLLDSSETCQDYNLGKELYDAAGINMDIIYGSRNLDAIFADKVKLDMYNADPSLDIVPPIGSDTDLEYVTRWSLIPEKYLNSYSSESPSCSYLTTVPVWCYIAEKFLHKLDTYVDIMTKVLYDGKLKIISGTSGTVRLFKKAIKQESEDKKEEGKEEEKEKEEKHEDNISESKKRRMDVSETEEDDVSSENRIEIYLDEKEDNHRMPMPASLYKVIEYESSLCPNREELCWYSAIIEIHNTLYFTSKDEKICYPSKCADLGWDLLFENSTFISCCQRTSEIEGKLKLPYKSKKPTYDLNLKEKQVLLVNENSQVVSTTLQKAMIDEMKKSPKTKFSFHKKDDESEADEIVEPNQIPD